MKTKEIIIEVLEDKRAKQVWDLIEKAYLGIFENINKKELEIAEEEYLEYEDNVNNEKNKYMLVEHYNLNDSFYARFYEDNISAENMFEDYFEDCAGGWQQILLVNMKEMKCYLLDKKVSYSKKEVEI